MAFLNRGLSITLPTSGPTTSTASRTSVTLPLRGRHRRLRPLPQRAPRSRSHDVGDRLRRRGRRACRSRSPCSGTRSYTESVYTFANTINTAEGGTHEEGFRAALTTVVNKYARDQKLLREKDENLTGEDVREGLTAIISVKLAEPQFEGQTKTKLGNTEAKSFVQKACNDHLRDWFERNPGEAKDDHQQGDPGRAGPDRRPAGARPDPAQGPAGVDVAAGQAVRLPVHRPGAVRDLRRRGRLGRRLGQGRPRPAVPGDPADPRQDPQRREGADRPGPEEHRGPGDDHRARHRHPRRLRHRRSCATTRSS